MYFSPSRWLRDWHIDYIAIKWDHPIKIFCGSEKFNELFLLSLPLSPHLLFCGFFGVSWLQLRSKAEEQGIVRMAILAEPTVPAERFGFVNVSQSFSQLKIKSRNVLEQVILILDCCLGKVQECNEVVLLTDELVLDGGERWVNLFQTDWNNMLAA